MKADYFNHARRFNPAVRDGPKALPRPPAPEIRTGSVQCPLQPDWRSCPTSMGQGDRKECS